MGNAADKRACPCGSGRPYAACCGRFIEMGNAPQTAEELMRSRYTAFTQGNESYLLSTWHDSTRPESLDLGAEGPVKWLGLRIDKVEDGSGSDEQGSVCFVARWRVGGSPAQRLEECSRFVRNHGRWFYLDGNMKN